jgi:hypothetical protein
MRAMDDMNEEVGDARIEITNMPSQQGRHWPRRPSR